MQTINLNLARKWRSKQFDQIVGQELLIKILKNSLYLGQFFPVYLFAGQRGCGKTSTARIFAAAVNCHALNEFQKNPKKSPIPCLQCPSCTAMTAGNHPDFFEIDAASHTGVDTIRTVIEASQLLPIMGSKKIYLIDEAHMLSKASCNALLKILEEPPQSVLFILATTDPLKIIETVRSRCFQLLFKPVAAPSLLDHLQQICVAEAIGYDQAGLSYIIQETDGSVRDAINLLEQVRFSAAVVDKESVLKVLGHLSDQHMLALLEAVLYKKPAQLLQTMQRIEIASYAPDFVWERYIELVRTALWIKYSVEPQQFVHHTKELQHLVARINVRVLHDMLDALYTKEQIFMRTTSKHALFEMILLALCKKYNKDDDSMTGSPAAHQEDVGQELLSDQVIGMDDEPIEDDAPSDPQADEQSAWQQFVHKVEALNDPLLISVFKQAHAVRFINDTNRLEVEFAKDLSFFNDWLTDTVAVWQPHLKALYGERVTFVPLFVREAQKKEIVKVTATPPGASVKTATEQKMVPAAPAQHSGQAFVRKPFMHRKTVQIPKLREPILDISDANKWPQATLLARFFPGVVTEIRKAS